MMIAASMRLISQWLLPMGHGAVYLQGEIALRGALLFLGDGQPQQHQAEAKADTKAGSDSKDAK